MAPALAGHGARGAASRARHALVRIGARARRGKARSRRRRAHRAHRQGRAFLPLGRRIHHVARTELQHFHRLGAARGSRAGGGFAADRDRQGLFGEEARRVRPERTRFPVLIFRPCRSHRELGRRLRGERPRAHLRNQPIRPLPQAASSGPRRPGARACVERRRSRRKRARSLARFPPFRQPASAAPLTMEGVKRDSPSAREVLLVGSVGLKDSEEVFRTVGPVLGGRMKRIPDGETGLRTSWVSRLRFALEDNPSFEDDPREAAAGGRITPPTQGTRTWKGSAVLAHGVPPPPRMRVTALERLAMHCNRVPRDVELGVHLCYGSYGGRHWKEPESTANMVEVHNRLIQSLDRPLAYIHMPVPVDRNDEAYFAPLLDLKLQRRTKLFLGLVHDSDGVEGTRNRIAVAVKYARDFGIAAECGFGRRPPETIPHLLRVHAEV